MLHDHAEDGGLQLRPIVGALGHGDEIGAEIDAGDAGNLEQSRGERRLRRAGGVGNVERAVRHHLPSGQEFQGRRIRREFGLDKHDFLPISGSRPELAVKPYMGEEFCGSKP